MPPIEPLSDSGVFSAIRLGSISIRRSRAASPAPVDRRASRELALFDSALRTLRRDLEILARGSRVRSRVRLGAAREATPASAISSSGLGLDPVATYTTLRSGEEVNTTPTSFTPFGPTVSGLTTSLPTLGGIYDGSQGDDVLSFEFRDDAVVGTSDKLRVRVRDGAGNTIGNLNFRNVPAGTPLTLSNGLSLSLSAGLVVDGDTFEVAVSNSVGSVVDPTLPFDGTRNQDPNFEPGLSVGPGSFDVNGVNISVGASDTLDSVLARITASAAGVDATFDAATERVLLTQQTSGSGAHIVLANDTSGFFAATKLAGESEVLGLDGVDPVFAPISSVPELSGISTGQFSVNGVSLAVDVDIDSLSDVLDRINASAAGVTATLDPDSGRLSVVSNAPEAVLELEDGTSGFFSAVLILPQVYTPQQATEAATTREARFENASALREDLFDVRRSLNAMFARSFGSESAEQRDTLRSELIDAIKGSLESLGEKSRTSGYDSRFGLGFDFEATGGKLLEIDGKDLGRVLHRSAPELSELLFSDEKNGRLGLVTALLERVESLQTQVKAGLGGDPTLGGLIDLLA